MKKLLFVISTFLLCSSANAFSQKIWFISDPERCNYWNLTNDLYQDLQTTKHGDSLRFAKNFSEVKNSTVGDFYIYYQCNVDEADCYAGGIALSVCETYGRIEMSTAGKTILTMESSEIYSFTQGVKDKNIRRSKLAIVKWLDENYKK